MLMGEYQHNMDAKGRVTIPSKYREDLGDKFYVCRGLDGCLSLFSEEQWTRQVEEITSRPDSQVKDVRRFFFSGADEVVPDKQGRILINPSLRAYASLTKDVTVIGVGKKAEIWDTERWLKYNEEMSSDSILADMTALQI